MPNCKLSDKGNCIVHDGANVEGCVYNKDTERCRKEPVKVVIEPPKNIIVR